MIKLKNVKIMKSIFIALLSIIIVNCNNVFSVPTDVMIAELFEMEKDPSSKNAEFIQCLLEKYKMIFDEKIREVRLCRRSHFLDGGVNLDCFKYALLINILSGEYKNQKHVVSVECWEKIVNIISDRTFDESVYDSALSPEFYRFQILKVF